VAGLLRSFDYVRHEALRRVAQTAPDLERFVPVARSWQERVAHGFLDAYRDAAVVGGLYADGAAFDATQPLLELFVLEKALYELRYEMDNRPDWIGVPLAGLAALAASA
jgi:maltose alpha-D-glucosyltransferase/alpha-amylase